MKVEDWERLAKVYAKEVCDIFMRDRGKVISRWLRAQGLLGGRKAALDIGCGIGSFFRKYGRYFSHKTGTDHSARMLHYAARRCRSQPEIAWRRADVLALPAELRASADLVVCSNVITFVSLPDCRRALRQVRRAARPGGRVLLIIPSLESHHAMLAPASGRRRRHHAATAVVRRDERMQRFFTEAGCTQLAAGAGLRDIKVQKVWYPWSDEGYARAPRGHEPPWDWLVTGRR